MLSTDSREGTLPRWVGQMHSLELELSICSRELEFQLFKDTVIFSDFSIIEWQKG